MITIKPSKITIKGIFWDVFLYKNILFLFSVENRKVKIIEWNKFVSQFYQNKKLELAYRCAFWNSDYLYDVAQKGIFNDKEFKNVLLRKFNKMIDIEVDDSDERLLSFDNYRIESNYPEYFADIDIYYNKIYLGGSNGLYSSIINQKALKRKPALEFNRIEETESLNISSMKFSNKGSLFLSTQDSGLYEYNTFVESRIEDHDNSFGDSPLEKINNEHSSYVGTNFSSIMSASYIKEPIFIQRDFRKNEYTDKLERYDKNIFNIAEIFNDTNKQGFYFSYNDKIYQILNGMIRFCHFNQQAVNQEDIFIIENIGVVSNLENENIISANVESFGVVIECKNKIIVILSDNSIYEYNGDGSNRIISFRTYPRSNCYTNQLHIVYSNKIEIISFNQDYFENQSTKKYGVKYKYKVEK